MTTHPDGPAPSQPADEEQHVDRDRLVEVIEEALETIDRERADDGGVEVMSFSDLAGDLADAIQRAGQR
ncbi:hypothetical protein ABTX81_30750 [Kitasatospora sp. NPDC097605]|uniref:hypothetical protein n=1 Tax=Kitasatospora sp. NPDC097605 TaxID=3157226 RepID=UPI00331771D7